MQLNILLSRLPAPILPHLLIAGGSLAALAGALISQYGFGWAPCPLCLWQRAPHAVVVALGVIALLIHKKCAVTTRHLLLMMAFALVINAGIATYHSLVERKIITASETCLGGAQPQDFDALKAQLLGTTKVARCDVPSELIPGFTMANANVLLCLVMAGFAASRWRRV